MKFTTMALLIGGSACLCSAAGSDTGNTPGSPFAYTRDGLLVRPAQYREWIYLTGFDMSYGAGMQMDHHTFDNVFVNPAAYKVFVATGTWPNGTALIIENRGARAKGSINKSGNYQGPDVEGLEVHVKDEARFPGQWAFFGFEGSEPAKMIPRTEACYSCHATHAAVDTTFVQFYPTLLPIAQNKGTLSAAYRKEAAAERRLLHLGADP
jgi:hypothetical protein